MIFREYDSSDFDSKISKAVTQKQFIALLTRIDSIVRKTRQKAIKFHNKGNHARQRVVINPKKSPDFSKVIDILDDVKQLNYFTAAFNAIHARSYDLEDSRNLILVLEQSRTKCREAINTILSIVNAHVNPTSPSILKDMTETVKKFCSGHIEMSGINTITLPHFSDEVDMDYSTFVILSNAVAARNFIIPNITICLTCRANYGNPFVTLSIPPDLFSTGKSPEFTVTKKDIADKLRPILESMLHLKLLKKISVPVKPIKKISNILDAYVKDNSLFVLVNSGTPAKQINSLIVRVISILYDITGISHNHSQILHKISLDEHQHRLIEFVIYSSESFNEKPINNLTKILSLSKDQVSELIRVAKATSH